MESRVAFGRLIPLPDPAPDSSGDAALVRAVVAGDQAAFAVLHARYARMVHAVLLARVPAQDADDLVQDVFLSALERLGTLRDGDAVGGWLARIARNRAVDFLRRRRPVEALPETLGAAPAPTLEASRALAAIRDLPEAYRETLLMRLVEGMTGPEIAEQTGLTPGSVRVNLHRGMAMLRDKLGGDG